MVRCLYIKKNQFGIWFFIKNRFFINPSNIIVVSFYSLPRPLLSGESKERRQKRTEHSVLKESKDPLSFNAQTHTTTLSLPLYRQRERTCTWKTWEHITESWLFKVFVAPHSTFNHPLFSVYWRAKCRTHRVCNPSARPIDSERGNGWNWKRDHHSEADPALLTKSIRFISRIRDSRSISMADDLFVREFL